MCSSQHSLGILQDNCFYHIQGFLGIDCSYHSRLDWLHKVLHEYSNFDRRAYHHKFCLQERISIRVKKMCWGLKTCTSHIFSPAPLGDSQQSAYFGKDAGQLFWPQTRFPWHWSLLSQSPWLIEQGASRVQQLRS